MARRPRLDFPGVPQHITQRGNNRNPCFFDEADYGFYLACLSTVARHLGCHVYAYVLMTNHVHLLMSSDSSSSISALMQALGRRYVRYINTRYRRTGTLWEGRFKSSLVDSERYLLTCYRYIELNPVRAGLVTEPAAYPWSSYQRHAYGAGEEWLADHEAYLALGPDAPSRQTAYRGLCHQGITEQEMVAIRSSSRGSGVLGSEPFLASLEAVLARRVRPGRPGRPKKRPATTAAQ